MTDKSKEKQALMLIEKICEKLITGTPEYHNCYCKDECGSYCFPKLTGKQGEEQVCTYEGLEKILDIIERVNESEEE